MTDNQSRISDTPMSITGRVQHSHLMEASLLIKEFQKRGFDCAKLGTIPVFKTAMSRYGSCKLTFDGLMDVAEALALLNPNLKREVNP